MATRVKTIQYSFPMYTNTTTDAVPQNLTQITLYIPETVVSFVSVTAELGFQDVITATGGTIIDFGLGLRLGSSAYTSVAETADMVHSGENIGAVFGPLDFTSLFTASWTGTSMTSDAQVYFDQSTGTTLGMRNITVTLSITYQYNDTEATQIKTVMIPLESSVAALSTSVNANLGTNQIPILTGGSGTLPENGVTIRGYYFLIEGNDNSSGTVDMTLNANIDGGTSTAFGLVESALSTGRFDRFIYTPTIIPTTTSVHNFQLWTDNTNRFYHITVTLIVTYEFTLASTTRTINSLFIPLDLSSPLGGITSAEASRFSKELYIAEPGTITLRQSAFRINYNAISTPTGMQFRAGAQAYRAYTTYAAGIQTGIMSLQQRVDSGGAQGAGISLSRGVNTFDIDGFITSNTDGTFPTNLNGHFIINYESDVASQGIGAHSHTVRKAMLNMNFLPVTLTRIVSMSPTIPETNYRLLSNGYGLYFGTLLARLAVSIDVECLSTEGKGGGYYDVYKTFYQSDAELSFTSGWFQGYDVMRRWPTDPSADKIDFKAARDYRVFSIDTTPVSLVSTYTYHAINFSVSGSISGSSGGTITINAYSSLNRELIYSTTRIGDGSFSFEWYDNVYPIYVEAYEDSGHFGRSANVIAGTTAPNVAFGGGVARAYA